MQVKAGGRLCLDARARAEPTDDLLFHDYYTRTPRLRLTGDPTDADPAVEVMLDAADVASLVECAVRHPSLGMRQAVLAAIWNHPDSFRAIFRFGLEASDAFAEIRKIVADELARAAAPTAAAAPAAESLLPRMPLPVHLRPDGRKP